MSATKDEAIRQANDWRSNVNRDERVPAWLLLEWLTDPGRKPAGIAFTEGPLRQIAYAVESAIINRVEDDARRYRRLRASLPGGASVLDVPTWMPRVMGPWPYDDEGMTAEGLDKALDRMR